MAKRGRPETYTAGDILAIEEESKTVGSLAKVAKLHGFVKISIYVARLRYQKNGMLNAEKCKNKKYRVLNAMKATKAWKGKSNILPLHYFDGR